MNLRLRLAVAAISRTFETANELPAVRPMHVPRPFNAAKMPRSFRAAKMSRLFAAAIPPRLFGAAKSLRGAKF
jgi:hypothetical protein